MLRYAIKTMELESTFSLLNRVLGVRITFFDADEKELPLESLKEMSPYCSEKRKNPEFNERCKLCDRQNIKRIKNQKAIQVYHCHHGLLEGIIPLYDKQDIYLGSIVFGQIRDVDRKMGGKLDARLARLLGQLPAYSMEKARDTGKLLKFVGEYIIHNEMIRYNNLQWVDKIESYIGAHMNRKISVKDLAMATGYSQSFIHHRFRTEFGMPPLKYIRKLKMENARKMFEEGKNVGEVSELLGFYDQFHFSRTFKKHWKVTPCSCRHLLFNIRK